jgi:hypothetical protein
MPLRDQILLDLGFLEFDVLPGNRIVLRLGHLVCHRTAVLRGYVEETGISRRQQLDLDGRSFCHGLSAFKKSGAADADGRRRNLGRNYKSRSECQPCFVGKNHRAPETIT